MVILKLIGVPGQEVPLFVLKGVTIIVAVIGFVPRFVPMKSIESVPEAAKPMAVLLFVQLKFVAFIPEKERGPIF